jgi:hypothetical protein
MCFHSNTAIKIKLLQQLVRLRSNIAILAGLSVKGTISRGILKTQTWNAVISSTTK